MISNIAQEQPPVDDPVLLAEWLTRMVILINGALETNRNFEPTGSLPNKTFEGLTKFFNRAILPEITYPGVWVIVEGSWKPMTPP